MIAFVLNSIIVHVSGVFVSSYLQMHISLVNMCLLILFVILCAQVSLYSLLSSKCKLLLPAPLSAK